MHCRYQSLDGFPNAEDFPEDVVELDFGYNRVLDMASSAVPYLPSLQKLVMDNCQVRVIGSNAFRSLPALRNLTLRSNDIESIHQRAFDGLVKLTGLYLEENNVKVLPANVFSGLSLQDLYLEGNAMEELMDGTFSGLQVEHLKLNRNNITQIRASHIAPLKDTLVSLHIDNNGRELTIQQDAFSGFAMEELSLKASQLKDLSFLEYVNVKTLQLSGNMFPKLDLRRYTSLGSVETIGLSEMGMRRFPADNVLANLRGLRKMDLSRNEIYSAKGSWFRHTPALVELNMAANRMAQLPPNFGDYLSSVKTLDLALNNLITLNPSSFARMTAMTKLDLRENKLQVFPNTMQPIFDRIPYLFLAGNRLHCNCEMKWFIEWLTKRASYTGADMCHSPMPQRTYIFNLVPKEFVCRGPTIVSFDQTVYASVGEDVYLTCVGEGDPAPNLEWVDPNGQSVTISPAINRTKYKAYNVWKLSNVQLLNSGNYTCIAANLVSTVRNVTNLVVGYFEPSTNAKMTTSQTTTTTTTQITTTPEATSGKTTATTIAINEQTTDISVGPTDNMTRESLDTSSEKVKTKISQTLLVTIIAIAGVFLIALFVAALVFHMCRTSRHRRRYDVNDKIIIYKPDASDLNMSKESKQIDV